MGPESQAVRMMAGAVLDHHRDAAAERMIDALDHVGILAEDRIDAAVDVQDGHVMLGQQGDLVDEIARAAGVVGIDAGDLVGIGNGPGVCELTAATHANECRLLRQAVLLGQEGVPGVPGFVGSAPGVGGDVGDVETAPQQLDLCL